MSERGDEFKHIEELLHEGVLPGGDQELGYLLPQVVAIDAAAPPDRDVQEVQPRRQEWAIDGLPDGNPYQS